MHVETTRFGALEIDDAAILHMDRGILGFEGYRRYVLIQTDEDALFRWLQCIDDPALAFVVADPLQWFPGYEVSLSDEDAAVLEIGGPDESGICAIVTLSSRLEETTANLVGPVIVNVRTGRAAQVILDNPRYHTRHRLMAGAPVLLASAA